MQCGGIQEHPDFTYEEHEVIEADSIKEALVKYNEHHEQDYYHSVCRGEVVDGSINLPIYDFVERKVTP